MDIDFLEPQDDEPRLIDEQIENIWAHLPAIPPQVVARRRAVLAQLGRAHLRLRLFRGWSQLDVERQSGVDQTTVSRFERADEQGLSIQRLAAMLAALNVGEIDFRPPPGPPPTPLELMIYGDRWQKSGKAADRRLARPRRQRR